MLIYAAKRAKSMLCKASHFEADRLSVAGESECLELEMRSRTKKLQQIQPTSTGPPPPPCTTANLVGGSDIAVHQLASGSCSGSLAGLRAAGMTAYGAGLLQSSRFSVIFPAEECLRSAAHPTFTHAHSTFASMCNAHAQE